MCDVFDDGGGKKKPQPDLPNLYDYFTLQKPRLHGCCSTHWESAPSNCFCT